MPGDNTPSPDESLHDAQTRACPLRQQPAWTCHSSARRSCRLWRVQECPGPVPGSLHQGWASNLPQSPLSIPLCFLGIPGAQPHVCWGQPARCWHPMEPHQGWELSQL